MKPESYKCPECRGTNFKRWALPHPVIVHWVLNPGLAFNEIVLGQRVPKTQLICMDCDGALIDRAYVPCPSCSAMHFGRLSAGRRSFRNWRGIACPSCGKAIPCLWNVFSLIVLAITFPLWALPYLLHFGKQPLKPLFDLDNGERPVPRPLTRKTWIYVGASWGWMMWIFMSLIVPLIKGGGDSIGVSALYQLPIWLVGGFLFGFSMWFWMGRKR